MDINIFQLLTFAIWVGLGGSCYLFKNKKWWICAAAIAFIAFFINPVKFEEEGGARLERSVSRFEDIPERVVVDQESYSDRQTKEHDKLKSESKEIENEI